MNDLDMDLITGHLARIHEAAHVVVGYELGHWLDERGVTVDAGGGGFAGLTCYRFEYSIESHALVTLAGPMAEHIEIDRPWPGIDVDDIDVEDDWDGYHSDDTKVFMLAEQVAKSNEDGLGVEDVIANWEIQTADLLADRRIWVAIGQVADSLADGWLSAEEVEELLLDGYGEVR